jgi:hypothetical protein
MRETTPTPTLARHSHKVKEFLFCHIVLHTHITKDCIIVKANLDSYNGFT